MSRSEFFTKAAQRYLHELDAQLLTGQIDRALEIVGEVEVWGRDVRDDRRVFVESPADEFGACRRVARQGIRVVGLPVSQRELVEPEAGCAARRSAAGSQ